MAIFANMQPGGIVAWIVVGLIAGWLAGKVVSGSGYGLVLDLVLGLLGALVGGFLYHQLVGGELWFWGSLLVAFLGACVLLAGYRVLGLGRRV